MSLLQNDRQACEKCLRQFRRKSELDRHAGRRTPCRPPTHTCSHCGKGYASYQTLWRHTKTCRLVVAPQAMAAEAVEARATAQPEAGAVETAALEILLGSKAEDDPPAHQGANVCGCTLSQKTYISPDQLETLKGLYERGMNSKGKKCQELQEVAVLKTGLPPQVIVDWIGNRNKKVKGRKYHYPKVMYSRGMSSFNCFVHEKKDEIGNMQQWADSWNQMASEDKKLYKEKAQQQQSEPSEYRSKGLLKKVGKMLQELKDSGIDLVCLGVNKTSGKQVMIGDGKAANFFECRPQIFSDLVSSFALDLPPVKTKIELQELRNKAQCHMNSLYAAASGHKVAFPYKQVRNGKIRVTGLPKEVLPLRAVSHYGEEKLKLLLNVKAIQIMITQTSDSADKEHSEHTQHSAASVDSMTTQTGGLAKSVNSMTIHTSGLVTTDHSASSLNSLSTPAEAVSDLPYKLPLPSTSNPNATTRTTSGSTLLPVDPRTAEEIESLIAPELSSDLGSDLVFRERKKKQCLKRKKKDAGIKKTKKKSANLPGFYEVERITGMDIREKQRYFHVKWQGYEEKDNTWEPETNVPKDLVADWLNLSIHNTV